MPKNILLVCLLAVPLWAQEAPKPGQPPVHVNVINVCTPSAQDQKEMAAALARIPDKPAFATDFEVARGRTSMPDAPVSNWVRVRREFTSGMFLTVQYIFSVDETGITETLALRVREPKDVMQISLEDKLSGTHDPATVLATDTPVEHVKIERFGKASLGLARCPQADQSAYDSLFRAASVVMSRYRTALGVRRSVPIDMRQLGVGATPAKPAKPSKPAASKSK